MNEQVKLDIITDDMICLEFRYAHSHIGSFNKTNGGKYWVAEAITEVIPSFDVNRTYTLNRIVKIISAHNVGLNNKERRQAESLNYYRNQLTPGV